MQCPSHLILVRPRDFCFNEQTSGSNSFQNQSLDKLNFQRVNEEFERVIETLNKNQLSFTLFDSPDDVFVPDAVFPNNWFASMPSGELITFPMFAANRRSELNFQILEYLEKEFKIKKRINLSLRHIEEEYLEGTGSIVFDHDDKLAFACESPRTTIRLFNEFCKLIDYTPISFQATDLKQRLIYHTNVLMSVGIKNVVICLEAIPDILERQMIKQIINRTGKKIIEITFSQMNHFCGNILQVLDMNNKAVWLMSLQAFQHFTNEQIRALEQSGKIITVDIQAIESTGGGSMRCMLAGIHAFRK